MTLCLADDLTGALEVGGLFAAAGHSARVSTSPIHGSADVAVFDTESRHLDGRGAAEKVLRFVSAIGCVAEDSLLYKKTDSTLRGNIGMELWALQKVYPGRELLYVPAYPALGRTVRNGHLVLNGTPIHETEFARDALNPIRTSDVGYVMAPAVGEILDSETEDDLGAIAQRIAADPGRYLMAGPAAIARYLAASGSGSRQDDGISLGRLAERRLLVVNGSRHSTSAGQIEFARGRGLFERLPWSEFQYQGGGSGVARAEAAGGEVRACLQRGSFDGILVFGGDTAYGIYSALHEPFLEGAGELLPGVPISRSQSGLWWITKAGGFGSVDLLERLSQFDLSASPSSSSS